jgi:MFS family permease
LISYLLIYFAAPVTYVGVVQAALCDKLGAGATVANLPAAANLVGHLAPVFVSWCIPLRLERSVLVWANVVISVLLAVICAVLILPLGSSVQIALVIGQSLVIGFISGVSSVYMYQCLGRGTSQQGRAKALKRTFMLGPISAVIGSLGAQFVLGGGISALPYPYDFALLYLIGIPCRLSAAWVSHGYDLVPLEEEPRPAFWVYITESLKSFMQVRAMVLLWMSYVLWYSTLNAMPNLSLYTREAMGRDPKDFSGFIMALRFGFKCLAGWGLGWIAIRWGARAPVTASVLLLAGAVLWAWIVPGHLYLLAFGLLGAGELGGAYIPNYALAISPPAAGARNLAILMLATPVSGLAPPIHGALTDYFGFSASFTFAIATALVSLWLILRLPSQPQIPTSVPRSANT